MVLVINTGGSDDFYWKNSQSRSADPGGTFRRSDTPGWSNPPSAGTARAPSTNAARYLAPNARPGSPATEYSGGPLPPRATRTPGRGSGLSAEQVQARYGNAYLVSEDNPAVYYGPGGALVYPANYRRPIYLGLGDAVGSDPGIVVSQYGANTETGRPDMLYKDGMARPLPTIAGWSNQDVTNFRAAAIIIRQFFPEIYDKPLGQQGIADWGTEGDIQAAKWMMGFANSRGVDIDEAQRKLLEDIEEGHLAPYEDLAAAQGLGDGSGSGAREYELLTKSVQKQVTLTAFDTARATLADQMRDLLGRDPSPAEIKQFLGTLNALERANPQVTTTEYTYDEERYGATPTETTSVTEPPDIDRGGLAFEEAVEGNEEEVNRFGLGRVRQLMDQMVGL